MENAIPLMNFLAHEAVRLGVADHVYVVGGAVRNHVLGEPVKDIDVVIDSVKGGKDSEWFAERIAEAIPTGTNLVTNQYGVAILTVKGPWVLDGQDLQGEKIEVANARKESYGGEGGKGYKPHMVAPTTIEEDLVRREFTFNTLMWRMSTLAHAGAHECPILDLTGQGFKHLAARLIKTPSDPDKTFSDDPTRTLRALKFIARYDCKIDPETAAAIRRNAHKLADMPWDAVRGILIEQVLQHPRAEAILPVMDDLGLTPVLLDMLAAEKGFSAAFGRAARAFPVHLMLALEERGFPMPPLAFLGKYGLHDFRECVFGASPMSREDAQAFFEVLQKPPVDNVALIEEFQLPPEKRGIITKTARGLLLEGVQPSHLQFASRRELTKLFGGTP